MSLFKCLFPLIFVAAASAALAQPQAPSGPLYDPQGRLIPYDPPTADASVPARAVSQPKAAGKKSKSKAAESKPASTKTGKAGKTSKAKKGSKTSKAASPDKAKAKKPASKTKSASKKKPTS